MICGRFVERESVGGPQVEGVDFDLATEEDHTGTAGESTRLDDLVPCY